MAKKWCHTYSYRNVESAINDSSYDASRQKTARNIMNYYLLTTVRICERNDPSSPSCQGEWGNNLNRFVFGSQKSLLHKVSAGQDLFWNLYGMQIKGKQVCWQISILALLLSARVSSFTLKMGKYIWHWIENDDHWIVSKKWHSITSSRV